MTHNLWSDLETYINNFFAKNTLQDIVYGVNKDKQRELSQ
jgi:DNA-binding IscR family transcriptional regulator